jgi:hypothetical protein
VLKRWVPTEKSLERQVGALREEFCRLSPVGPFS